MSKAKKPLPSVISAEVQLPVDYVILRGMTSERAYRTVTRDGYAKAWFKVVKDEELGYQFQIHIRFFGRDFWFGDTEDVDVDLYIPILELSDEFLAVLKDLEEAYGE